ncbi:SRPBCC family protein [Hoyosella rhizosphaerae]|uniref:SRPBCC family protein n=1 Tax=Hoyosella rhizosphaerae TaxID=1755582 RepID=UPI001E2844FD|nr:SRPBCC family protein [Hoyosella rhizosphaerae]
MRNIVEVEKFVNSPIGNVWRVITDLDHSPQILSSVTRVERLTEGSFRVGMRWRETRKLLGKEATEEMWVSAMEVPGRIVITSEDGGVRYVSEIHLTEVNGGTDVVYTFSAELPELHGLRKLVSNTLGYLGAAITKRMISQDLDDIARAATAAH